MESIHSTDSERDAAAYRPISGLAVAAAGAGVLSAASLIGPAFLIVPLVAVALAVAALGEIGREGSVKVGRVPAVFGLALAVAFATQGIAYRAVQERIVAARAAMAVRQFILAVRESRFADARAMCGPTAVSGGRSAPPPTGGEGVSTDDAFRALPAVGLLAACREEEGATLAAEPPLAEYPAARSFLVTVSCRPPQAAGRTLNARVRVVVERVDPDGWGSAVDRWRVVGHEVVAPPFLVR